MMRIIAEGLTRKDYRWKRIAKIEKAVEKEVLGRMENLGLPKEDIKFFFPRDTSITSNDVPVEIILEISDALEMTKKAKDSLSGAVAVAFAFTVGQWRTLSGKSQARTITINRDVEGFFCHKR